MAFANSRGGHLILGMRDNGVFDGVPLNKARTTTREWLEQILPNLLTYPRQDFRVHSVIRAEQSQIPQGRDVIVIDVGDSSLAPHQATGSGTYYQRAGGHSVAAGHFYLETLRTRLTRPSLEVDLVRFSSCRCTFGYGTPVGSPRTSEISRSTGIRGVRRIELPTMILSAPTTRRRPVAATGV